MVNKRQTPKETRARIIVLYESGASRQEIQYETRVSQPTIRKILAAAGYPPNEIKPSRPITAEERAEIIRLFNLGLPSRAIANELGRTKRAVLDIIRDATDQIKTGDNKAVSAIAFIEAWQTSQTLPEVAYRLGMSTVSVYQRAAKYKARGVQLKKMPSRPEYRWSELNDFAKLFDTGESE